MTGSSSGIGAACVERFTADGARVVGGDLGPAAAGAVAPERFETCDVTDEALGPGARRRPPPSSPGASTAWSPAPGSPAVARCTWSTGASWDHVVGVNLKGTFLTAKHVITQMLGQEPGRRRAGERGHRRERRGPRGHGRGQLVQRLQGRRGDPDQEHGHRLRPPGHPGRTPSARGSSTPRCCARLGDPGARRDAPGDHARSTSCAASVAPRRSPRWPPSWCPPTPRSSPGRRSPSTVATPPARPRRHHPHGALDRPRPEIRFGDRPSGRYHLLLVRPRPPAGSRRAHLFVDRTDVCDGPFRSRAARVPRSTTDWRSAGGFPVRSVRVKAPIRSPSRSGETTQIPHRKIVAVMANKAVVGEKVGMTQVWDDDNRVVPVTVLKVEPMRVVQVKTTERDGYTALQVTFGDKDARKLNKPDRGPLREGRRRAGRQGSSSSASTTSRASRSARRSPSTPSVSGELVDVTAVSKGKGFAGAMKRHNFSGQRASHGAHRVHRAPGSIGACATPARVLQGHPDGRPHGRREGHDPEPEGRLDRRREEPAAREGRRARAPRAGSS